MLTRLITVVSTLLLMYSFSLATVTFTQSTDDDFFRGHQADVLIGGNQVFLPNRADGLSTWASTTDLPQPLIGHGIVTKRGYAYLVGGFNSGGVSSAVYRTPIDVEGVGGWEFLGDLPLPLHDHAVVLGTNHLYVLGGMTAEGVLSDQIFYAETQPDGYLGSWQTSATTLPVAMWGHTAAFIEGNLYILGGTDQLDNLTATAAAWYAHITPYGELTPFMATTPLPEARSRHTSVVYDRNLYVLGGLDNDAVKHNSVLYAGLNPDGTLTAWAEDTPLPDALIDHSTTFGNGLITVMAGLGELEDLYSKQVYYASLADAPQMTWNSAPELLDRRINGAAFIAGDEIVYTGGEHLSGDPLDYSRYSFMSFSGETIREGTFVSYPFLQLGTEMNMLNFTYEIDNQGDSSYEFMYRTAGEDQQWNPWISTGELFPADINVQDRYAQYMLQFYSDGSTGMTLDWVNLNIFGTQITGNISNIDTFRVTQSPYWATEDVFLTGSENYFEPGVIMMFSPNTGLTVGESAVHCVGTEEDSIRFTAYNNDLGQWNGIYFDDNSDDLNDFDEEYSIFQYVVIEGAGNGDRNANLYCWATDQPQISHSSIRQADGMGIRLNSAFLAMDNSVVAGNTGSGLQLTSSNPSLDTTIIQNNGYAGIFYNSDGLLPNFNATEINGNLFGIYSPSPNNSFTPLDEAQLSLTGNNTTMAIGGGIINTDQLWAYYPGGYAVLGDLQVYVSSGTPRLTLEAGVTINFDIGVGLEIGGSSSQGGELYALGSADSPITFTALNGEIGGWEGIYFKDGSDYTTATSLLDHVVIEKAASFGIRSSSSNEPHVNNAIIQDIDGNGFYLESSDMSLENVDINRCSQQGFWFSNANPSLVLVDVSECAMAAFYFNDVVSFPAFYTCTIDNCDFAYYYPTPNISFDNLPADPVISNVVSAVATPGGYISSDQTWPYIEGGYAILSNLTVRRTDALATLTIAAGNTVRFAEGVTMQVGSYRYSYDDHPGALIAIGTAEMPITFTALNGEIGG